MPQMRVEIYNSRTTDTQTKEVKESINKILQKEETQFIELKQIGDKLFFFYSVGVYQVSSKEDSL